MDEHEIDPARFAVWDALAEHFLDTERRHEVPRTALVCVESGFDRETLRHIWHREVVPAVGFNLFDVAGEWAMWPRDWLVERITAIRRDTSVFRRALQAATRGRDDSPNAVVWEAIEASMEILDGVDERRSAAGDMEAVARHYFDFCAPTATASADERARLRRVYATIREPILARLTDADERPTCESRVERALADAG